MLLKPLLPRPPSPEPTSTGIKYNAFIQQAWPASLCLASSNKPCERFTGFTDFILTDIGRLKDYSSYCDPTANFNQQDVPSDLNRLWGANFSIDSYWSKY